MLVKLTEKGRVEEQGENQDPEDIFACLTKDEQKTMGDLLDKIISSLHANAGEEDEERQKRMEALRERFGDDAPFGESFRGHGGFGFDRFGHGGFRGHHGFDGCGDNGF